MAGKPEFVNFKGDGITLAGASWHGNGPTVVCVHGMAGSCLHWKVVARDLAGDANLLALDLRGRGLSDKPAAGYGVDQHRRDVLAMMNGLGLDSAVIMGHSLGASIALSLAANNPERVEKLILVDGGGDLSQDQKQKVLAGIQPTLARLGKVFPSFEAYLALMKAAPMLQPWSADLEDCFRYDAEAVADGVRSRVAPHAIEEEIRNLPLVNALGLQKRVVCPTLILRADQGMVSGDDLLLPMDVARTMLANIKGASLINVEGSNHYTIVLKPQAERDQAIAGFLGL